MLDNKLIKSNLKNPNNLHPLKIFQKKQQKKHLTYFIICFLIIVSFICSLTIMVAIYFKNWENQLVIKISEKIPLPVLVVGKNIIWLNDYYKELFAVRNFYQKQYPLYSITDNQIKYQVLDKLIKQEFIEEAGKKYQLSINNYELDQEIKNIEQNFPGQDFNQLIREVFGWDFNEFVERVIKISILTEKLNNFFLNQKDFQLPSKTKINNLQNQLKNGVTFSELGEEIGWFREEDLDNNIFEKLKNLSIGQISEIIETASGYFILKLENKIVLEDQQIGYQLNQIFVKKYDLTDYLQEQFQKIKIYRFINI